MFVTLWFNILEYTKLWQPFDSEVSCITAVVCSPLIHEYLGIHQLFFLALLVSLNTTVVLISFSIFEYTSRFSSSIDSVSCISDKALKTRWCQRWWIKLSTLSTWNLAVDMKWGLYYWLPVVVFMIQCPQLIPSPQRFSRNIALYLLVGLSICRFWFLCFLFLFLFCLSWSELNNDLPFIKIWFYRVAVYKYCTRILFTANM